MLAYFFVYRLESSWLGNAACVALLLGLTSLQAMHYADLIEAFDVVRSKLYSSVLFLVAPAFYLFSREILQLQKSLNARLLLLFVPFAMNPLLSNSVSIPLSFLLGTACGLWLAATIRKIRKGHRRYQFELAGYSAFTALAILMLLCGITVPWIGGEVFAALYATSISVSLAAILFALLKYPDLVIQTVEAARAAYSASTLGKVNCEAALTRLHELMEKDKIYKNEALDLNALAGVLELTPHQLSELINTHFGVGFSRFIREQRVAAAKRMLVEEPSASVLSIGLSVGFTSQSNFYAAFRDITGEAPGQFRKAAIS